MEPLGRASLHFGFLLVCLGIGDVTCGQVSSQQFEARRGPALDVEESYDFLRQHTEGLPPRPRDPATVPARMRWNIDAGWSIEASRRCHAPGHRERGASALC